MRSVDISQATVCSSTLVFLTYQFSEAISRHAFEASYGDATSVTKFYRAGMLIGYTDMARKVLVCKIIGV
jgi:hypothetical protein